LHPYPAKFIPQIPSELIRAYSKPGDVVLDPMCGSGTTLVEAISLGRPALGNDINPVSVLITRAKTTPLNDHQRGQLLSLRQRVQSGDLPPAEVTEFTNRSHWFSDEVSATLAALRHAIEQVDSAAARDLALATFSAIIVGVSFQDSETRWARKERQISRSDVLRKFETHLGEDLRKNLELAMMRPAKSETSLGDARSLPFEDGSVNLVVTSPPYANSHDYYLYNKLRMFWLGFDVKATQEEEFGSRNKHSDRKFGVEHYLDSMQGVLKECFRVLHPGGRACIVVGDAVIRGEFFNMGELIPTVGELSGMTLETKFRFDQQKFTRAFMRGFGTRLEKSTHVIVMSRPGTRP
jgi:site-specific DNA-methyltransferase (cytosine-N4-specific)